MKQWYRMEPQTGDASVVDIYINDFIGDWIDDWYARNWGYDMGVTARAFIDQLVALPAAVKTIRVHINSPGGDVFAAILIANALRDQQASKGRTVECFAEGLVASAATLPLMAGSKVVVADNALVMVHNPWTVAVGNAADLAKTIAELDKVRNTIVATYKWHSTLDDAALVALMDAETWMDATEALANGFATEVVEGLKAAAMIPAQSAKKLTVPEKFRARVDALLAKPAEAPKALAATDILRLCREGNVLDLAESLVAANATQADVTAAISAESAKRTAAATRAADIRALCASSKQPELADGYINGAMSLADVRAHLTVVTAKVDKVEIDSALPVDQGALPKDALSPTKIYDARKPKK
jgi:ATP-dependent protease ClpP protease subunit